LVPTTLSSHRFHPKTLLFPLLWSSSCYSYSSSFYFAFSFAHFAYAVLYPSNFSFPFIDPLFSFYFGIFLLFFSLFFSLLFFQMPSADIPQFFPQVFTNIYIKNLASSGERETGGGGRLHSRPRAAVGPTTTPGTGTTWLNDDRTVVLFNNHD
jgi:energy-coupling factor transporter transmembrane protein EcfT